MIPTWLTAISAFSPFLLLIALGVAVFGFIRLKSHIKMEAEEQEEEEQKRQEFLKTMEARLQDGKSAR